MSVDELVSKAGGVAQLAATLGVARPTIYDWLHAGSIPGGRLIQIHQSMNLPIDQIASLVKKTPRRKARHGSSQ